MVDDDGIYLNVDEGVACYLLYRISQESLHIDVVKGTVDVAEVSAQHSIFLDEEDLETLIGKLERRRHAADAAADNKCLPVHVYRDLSQRFDMIGVHYGHSYKGLRLLRRVLFVVHMDP